MEAAQKYDHNVVSIKFFKTIDGTLDQNLDQLDSSFMYTPIIKKIYVPST